jgi:hypothetical protein
VSSRLRSGDGPIGTLPSRAAACGGGWRISESRTFGIAAAGSDPWAAPVGRLVERLKVSTSTLIVVAIVPADANARQRRRLRYCDDTSECEVSGVPISPRLCQPQTAAYGEPTEALRVEDLLARADRDRM